MNSTLFRIQTINRISQGLFRIRRLITCADGVGQWVFVSFENRLATRWTLPSNLAIAVNPAFTYLRVTDKKSGEKWVLGKDRSARDPIERRIRLIMIAVYLLRKIHAVGMLGAERNSCPPPLDSVVT